MILLSACSLFASPATTCRDGSQPDESGECGAEKPEEGPPTLTDDDPTPTDQDETDDTSESGNDDPESPYTGGWPFQPDKDSYVDPGFDGGSDVGDVVPRFAYVDQYGEQVDFYDFAFHDVPIVLHLGAMWSSWDQELYRFVTGSGDTYYFDDYDPDAEVEGAIRDGKVYWVLALLNDQEGDDGVDASEVLEFAQLADDPGLVPVLGASDGSLVSWADLYGYPTLILVNEDLTIAIHEASDYFPVLDAVKEL